MLEIRRIIREEIFRINEEQSMREKISQEFKNDFGDMELVQKTRNGLLYRKAPGVMVKVTLDKSEFDNALRFVGRPHKSFIKYFDAKPWKEFNGKEFYVLEMEEVKELDNAEWDFIDLVQNSLGSQNYMLDDNRRWAFLAELKRNPEWYEDVGTYKEASKLVLALYSMYKEADRRGFVLYDLRAQNVGRTMDGRLVHFDIGDEY